ncbi:MAG TPA: MFS transporter [Bryobacteraceae bacterium]|nr:MFS transporter [Bryobacteraceae bacterium]
MTQSHTGRLTWSAFAGMAVFGFAAAVTGAILPRYENLGLGQAGNLFFVLALAMLASMLVLGPVIDRFGKKPPLVAGAVLVSVALVLMANAAGYSALLVSVALLGFGGSALNGGSNTLIADLHEDPARKGSALNLLGVFFGFGALVIPFTIGALVDTLGLAVVLYLPAAFTAGVALLFAALPFPPPRHAKGVPLAQTLKLLRNPLVLLFAFTLFCQSGNEFVFAGYFSSYMTREMHVPISTASYILAAFWATIMLARVIASRVLLRAPGSAVVLVSAAGTAAGLGLLAVAPSSGVAIAAILLTGFATSSVYPTVLGLAGAAFAEYSGTVFGILFSIALVGGMLVPWAVGHFAEANGLRAGLMLPLAGAAGIFILQAAAGRVKKA